MASESISSSTKIESTTQHEEMEFKVKDIANQLFGIAKLVKDFQEGSQKKLNDEMNAYIQQLIDLDKMKKSFNLQIPNELINFIEEGKTPDAYIQTIIQTTVDKNQKLVGKATMLKEFEKDILEELQNEFPRIHQEYLLSLVDL